MEYTDYDYYSDTYKGSLDETSFNSYITKASKEIDKNINIVLTQDIIDILTEADQSKLKYTTCEMVDFFSDYNTISTTVNAVESISIDGVSKKYKTTEELTKEKGTKMRSIVENLPHELTRYL